MHLLNAKPGEISDGAEPVDPGQSPADLIVISAADTELAALSEARAALAEAGAAPSLRLAQLGWLAHPFSVDLYLRDTATGAKLVVARVLGGEAYWPYGIEQFAARLKAAGVLFAALPGDDKPDDGLRAVSTIGQADWERLWGYLVEGGPANARNFLSHCRHLIGEGEPAPAPSPLLRAGLYWPGRESPDLDAVRSAWAQAPGAAPAEGPVAAVVFYRALLQGAGLHPVNRLVRALLGEGLRPLPIFVASLKDPVSAATLARYFEAAPPDVVLNATAFAAGALQPQGPVGGGIDAERAPGVLDAPGAPVLQVVFSGGSEADWEEKTRGLSARDIAMNVALPEVDGRILSRAVSFKDEAYFDEACQCAIAAYRARGDRVSFVAALAAAWARLRRKPAAEKRIGLVLANYPTRDGRLANGVGLDAPESAAMVLSALKEAGYAVSEAAPADGAALMARLLAGPTNARQGRAARPGGEIYPFDDYKTAYAALPWDFRETVESRWGPPEADPMLESDAEGRPVFRLAIHRFGAVALGLQPARGYDIDPEESYHAPDLPPPHAYLAFYFWLRRAHRADAVIHLGKHGTLEWLPGKAVALSEECAPEAVFGPTPHLYPFIVNDPGEGTQAKRRAQAVIVDHLTPPLTRAESYGALARLEALVDEYYEAQGLDPRRMALLAEEILALTSAERLDLDAGLDRDAPEAERLAKIDAYLCELKEAQIRNGLHVFGRSPAPAGGALSLAGSGGGDDGDDESAAFLETDLIVALTRAPRGAGEGGDASLIRALSLDLLGAGFDPLTAALAEPWTGARPEVLAAVSPAPWRTAGDALERLEALAQALVAGSAEPGDWPRAGAVLAEIETRIRPAVRACGAREIQGLLTALEGRFLAPGPSGAPTRGRLDVLPTGRNFYSIDSRAAPTPAAWSLGWRSASLLIERHLQEEGDWLRAAVLTAWGTANMRTGGDDLAQGLALMGVRPRWDENSRRVIGFEILPLSALARPRVDVTLRISGFFRDAFPAQVDLFASAARAVMALDEPEDQNPAAARYRQEIARLAAEGVSTEDAARAAGHRVFGARPGAYGAGLQALIDERVWSDRADLGRAYLEWGSYAYGAGAEGEAARGALETRLAAAEAVIQNQDNREHDLLDSDDYYQFEGGAAAAVESLRGAAPKSYHNDHSRPERPVIRTLEEEIARVVRSRVANPKWIAGARRHGYKGAFEIAATVDYLFAFAAATDAVRDHHFDLVYDAVLEDAETQAFLAEANAPALQEIRDRLREAVERGLWRPRRNGVRAALGL